MCEASHDHHMASTSTQSAIQRTLDAVARGPSLLALDYDGTLAPFRVERDEARPPAEVRALLQQLTAATSTRVVIVSGRGIADLEALLDIEPLPEIYGVHGWEHRLADGSRADRALPPAVTRALDAEVARLGAGDGGDGGGRIERKSAGLALHWRGLDAAAAAAVEARVGTRWRELAAREGFEVRAFDGGLELRRPGRDKGDVMRDLLASTPSGAAVAYLGDDETDEDAFRALDGRGLALLVAAEPRPTAAHEVIAHDGVAGFLRDWLANAERDDA